ncbi:hypothetical protein [Nostoc sp.]
MVSYFAYRVGDGPRPTVGDSAHHRCQFQFWSSDPAIRSPTNK